MQQKLLSQMCLSLHKVQVGLNASCGRQRARLSGYDLVFTLSCAIMGSSAGVELVICAVWYLCFKVVQIVLVLQGCFVVCKSVVYPSFLCYSVDTPFSVGSVFRDNLLGD
jgi:hypothetical protein